MTSAAEVREQIKALEASVKVLEAEEQAIKKAQRDAVKRQWKFTIAPADRRGYSDRMYDDSCKWYYLRGEVVNKADMLAAGHSEDTVRSGGYSYLYNSLSHKIVTGGGGGNLYINEGSFTNNEASEIKEDAQRIMDALGAFITESPEGGDVTEIILSQRHFSWK